MSAKYMPQNTEMIITETLTKYQLRGYNKNQSLILSPLAFAKFISVGEGFPDLDENFSTPPNISSPLGNSLAIILSSKTHLIQNYIKNLISFRHT